VVIRSPLGPARSKVGKLETETCYEKSGFGFLAARRCLFFQSRSWKKRWPLLPGFLSWKAKKYIHPSTAGLPFRHSGTILAGIQKYAGLDSG